MKRDDPTAAASVAGGQRELGDALPAGLAALSAGAAAIHVAVVGEHLDEYWLFGMFFAGVAALQALWGLLVLARAPRPVHLAGALGNAAVVAIWALSRTAGLPVGPEPGVPEPAGLLDVAATAYEVLIVLGVLALLRPARVPRPLPAALAAPWLLMLVVVGLTAASLIASA